MSAQATPSAESKKRSGDEYLRVYLTDHHAADCGGNELARRALSNNEENEVGAALRDHLLPALEQDRETLEKVMERLGMSPQWWKDAAAWAAERVGRLKPNAQLTGYSPLSRFIELEGLGLGVLAKRAMWVTLKELAPNDMRLGEFDFDELIRRADEQHARLEDLRMGAGEGLFA
ncbi:MAG TPA: hypothetical protein VM784_11590 [Actinomycetota bacterium]|nr:hypothetical protein [Actinomycetota bacterium]